MNNRTVRYLALSQLSLLIFLSICVVIIPRFLFSRDEGGVSNYATYGSTVIPFTLAFGGNAIFILLAARSIAADTPSKIRFKKVLYVLGAMVLITMLSTFPYHINTALKDLHIITSIVMICTQLAIAYWLDMKLVDDKVNRVLFGFEALGFILAALSLPRIIRLLFVAQIILFLAFGAMLIYSYRRFNQLKT
jgi:hypothetical protein